LSSESEKNEVWQDAWESGCTTMKGVERRRIQGSETGIELAVLDWGGEGDLIVLHHATGFCGATLAPIAHALSDRYRVVAVDARGHGDSTPIPPGPDLAAYAWSTLADDLHRVMKELLVSVGAPSVRLAMGHSFGGALVLAVAQREPALIEKVLACDPVVYSPMSIKDNESRASESGLAEATLRRRDRFPSKAEAYAHLRSRALFANFTKEALGLYVGEGIRETAEGDVTLKCEREMEAAVFQSAALSDLFSSVEEITAEVLILHAAIGNFEREKYDALAERIPNARVDSLDLGHLFPMEEPDRVLAAIAELLEND